MAETLAEKYGNDGHYWREDGVLLGEAAQTMGATEEYRYEGWYCRYEFPDGSAILTTPEWWDLEEPGKPWHCKGFPDCELGAEGDEAELDWR